MNCSVVSINLPPDLVICKALLIREGLACGPMKAFVVDNIMPRRKKNREIGDLVDFILSIFESRRGQGWQLFGALYYRRRESEFENLFFSLFKKR